MGETCAVFTHQLPSATAVGCSPRSQFFCASGLPAHQEAKGAWNQRPQARKPRCRQLEGRLRCTRAGRTGTWAGCGQHLLKGTAVHPHSLFLVLSLVYGAPIECRGFPGGSDGRESACNAGDPGFIPGSGIPPERGNGNPLQYSCWRIPWTEESGRLQSTGLQKVGHN